jgi:phosphatidylinositol alpha-1,6-mannosyltransferase
VVYTADMGAESAGIDGGVNYPIIRDPRNTLLPTKRGKREVLRTFTDYGCDAVLFASSVPLGLLAKPLRQAGAQRIVALTHGHEVWYARLPIARRLLRVVAERVDYLTAVSNWTKLAIGKALPPQLWEKQEILSPGVDPTVFHPGAGGDAIRTMLGLSPSIPLVVCPARAIACKGQDKLIAAWPTVITAVPDAILVIVGDGNYLTKLITQAHGFGLRKELKLPTADDFGITAGDKVLFVGSVTWEQVAAYDDAADVIAMPSRPRLFGLGPEGFPLVFMEAAACAKPVIVGRNGGAPEGTLDGISGFVVDPNNVPEIAGKVIELLLQPELAREMGARGREWVLANHTWDQVALRCAELLGR